MTTLTEKTKAICSKYLDAKGVRWCKDCPLQPPCRKLCSADIRTVGYAEAVTAVNDAADAWETNP